MVSTERILVSAISSRSGATVEKLAHSPNSRDGVGTGTGVGIGIGTGIGVVRLAATVVTAVGAGAMAGVGDSLVRASTKPNSRMFTATDAISILWLPDR